MTWWYPSTSVLQALFWPATLITPIVQAILAVVLIVVVGPLSAIAPVLVGTAALLSWTYRWATEGTVPRSELPSPYELAEARLDMLLKADADCRPSWEDYYHPMYLPPPIEEQQAQAALTERMIGEPNPFKPLPRYPSGPTPESAKAVRSRMLRRRRNELEESAARLKSLHDALLVASRAESPGIAKRFEEEAERYERFRKLEDFVDDYYSGRARPGKVIILEKGPELRPGMMVSDGVETTTYGLHQILNAKQSAKGGWIEG